MRLLALGIHQVDLLKPLNDRGIKTAQCELNLAINGRGTQPKHKKILDGVNSILTEMEGNNGVDN